jgi:hypothetical protein
MSWHRCLHFSEITNTDGLLHKLRPSFSDLSADPIMVWWCRMFGQTSPGISSEIHLALIAFHLQKKVQRGRKVARMRKAVRIHTSPTTRGWWSLVCCVEVCTAAPYAGGRAWRCLGPKGNRWTYSGRSFLGVVVWARRGGPLLYLCPAPDDGPFLQAFF